MRRIGVIGVIIGGVLALSTAVAPSAIAFLPLFTHLPSGKAFTGSEGTTKLAFGESLGGLSLISCQKGTASGEITDMATVGKVRMKFTECEAQREAGESCGAINTVGAVEGEIATLTLKGLLGITSEASVGLLLEAEPLGAFMKLAHNECTEEGYVTGRLAGEVSPVDRLQTTEKLLFAVASRKQRIKEITVLDRSVKPVLAFFTESVTAEAEANLHFEGTVEIT